MLLEEIQRLHGQFVQPGFGTTTPEELDYIQRLIAQHRPKRVVEIGTASGMTTGFMAHFMAENGGESITSIDLSAKFFGDADKPVGYLASKVYPDTQIDMQILPRTSALDFARLGGPWDLAFIDANHQHPWPTVDTLALAPHLRGPKIVIHHDLQLYRRFRVMRGIGPRVLFNEMPDSHRHADSADGWNIFSIDLTLDPEVLEHVAIGALSMPWTSRPSLTRSETARFENVLKESYSPYMLQEFRSCRKHNRVSLPSGMLFASRRMLAQALETLNLRQR